jgi:hypothetical protein
MHRSWLTISVLISTAPVILSCSPRIDFDECVQTYATKGNTQNLVRWGYAFCKTASDDTATAEKRREALCAVKQIPNTPTEIGFRLVVQQCQRK